LQQASKTYFTPLHVAKIAVQWLTEDGKKRVLDIGAGVGKFCVTGANNSNSYFHGAEYRPSLVKIAEEIIDKLAIKNAMVENIDIVDVDFTDFDAFYMYNPFYENFLFAKKLNGEVKLSSLLYEYYFSVTEKKLDRAKTGTRLVTYHGNNFEVPESFKKIKQTEDGLLKLWMKK
jgi:hypothetical protein